MKKSIIAAAIAAMIALPVAAQSNFTETNMGFEDGTTAGWTIGDNNTGNMTTTITQSGSGVSLITGSPGTVTWSAGAYGAAGTPGTLYYQPAVSPTVWQFSAYGSNMLALQPNLNNTWATVGANLGLTSGQISSLSSTLAAQASASGWGSGTITNLAYVYRTVNLTTGVTYRMAWNYIGTDYVPFNDGSITTLVPLFTQATPIVTTINNYEQRYALLGFTNPGTGDYSAGTFGSTGWQISTYSVDTAGDYRLGFAVFNLDDTGLSPVLLIDDLQGTTTANGTTFGAVAPNPGTSAPDSSSGGGSPTLVSTAAGADIVNITNTLGTPTVATAVTRGTTITVVTLTDTRTGVTKVLSINRNTNTVDTTPVTTTTTTTTPVTVTNTTTPTTIETYSDGSTVTVNGTPVVTTTSYDSVAVSASTVNEVITTSTDQAYSTRVDQIDYMDRASRRFNRQLDSDSLLRNVVRGDTIVSRTEQPAEQGQMYVILDTQRSNLSDTYRMSAQRWGLGHEKRITGSWLVGAHVNQIRGELRGDASGGDLTKTHVGLYSLWVRDGFIVKTDVGVARNEFTNNHGIPELSMSNTGTGQGRDAWIANRLYLPDNGGFRPFIGTRLERNSRDAVTETGTAVTAMTYEQQQQTRGTAETGARYEHVWNGVNLAAEAGRTTNAMTTVKVAAAVAPSRDVLAAINAQHQRQDGVANNIIQFSLKWLLDL